MSRTAEAAPGATRTSAAISRACACGLAAVAVLAASVGCGGSSSTPGSGSSGSSGASSGTEASGGTAVQVQNFSFNPASLSVPVGAKVTWTFADSAAHNVKADDGSFSSPTLSNGKTYSYTFSKAGTYHYICTIHQYMSGTITVK